MSPAARTILVVGQGADAVARALDGAQPLPDLDRCLERTRSLQATGTTPDLVAVLPSLRQPLTAARRLRELDGSIALAIVVAPDDVPSTRMRMALVPDLPALAVVPWASPAELVDELRDAADRASRQRELERARSAMNRELAGAVTRDRPAAREGVSARYLATLIRHAPDAIIAVDGGGCVITANPAAVDLLETGDDVPEGRELSALVPADDPGVLAGIMAAVRHGEVRDGVEFTVTRGDETRVLSVTAAPIDDGERPPAGAVFLARDITAQRQADERLQQLQRAEGLATLAGGVAHDFNNLLMTIRGWTTIAEQEIHTIDTVPDALRSAIEHIDVAANRAAELSRSMLAYSGKGDVQRSACDVNELVDDMRGLFAASVPKGIDVRIDLAAASLPTVDADATQLRQVLLNLVTNAAEAIGEGPGRIEISTRSTGAPGPSPTSQTGLPPAGVQLVVRDTGHGMDDATTARIFEPFFTTRFAGRGLGLAATFGIVRAHGGDIEVASEPGRGSTFVITLPADRPSESS